MEGVYSRYVVEDVFDILYYVQLIIVCIMYYYRDHVLAYMHGVYNLMYYIHIMSLLH